MQAGCAITHSWHYGSCRVELSEPPRLTPHPDTSPATCSQPEPEYRDSYSGGCFSASHAERVVCDSTSTVIAADDIDEHVLAGSKAHAAFFLFH